jgi:catechol 2,3-dioxygenase-like lactoylglutathione lyase family enzyme
MVDDVFHFSFTVADIERSCAWYTDVLGLELVHRQRQDNPYTRKLVGIADAVLEIAQFKIPGLSPRASTHMLELVEYVAPTRNGVSDLSTSRVGGAHLCFVVADIKSEYERLSTHGVDFVSPPLEIAAGVNRGGFGCYFHDPDGITLELHQPPANV